ncbi:helix-turn-helix domain-containing protein [Dokdonia genika]|uniref:Helix-turn-helix domain-containing protein n=1 Tax=Dokdonia genika TaxID=308113 RepID=A0ABV9L8T6_9FLAO
MKPVKTYQRVNTKKEDATFAISRMEDIYDKHNGKVDEPHRHNYFTVLIIKQASGEHKIDFKSYALAAHQVYFVAPGQVHQVIETEKSFGYVMTFSNQFLVANSISLAFIDSLNLFQNYGHSPPLLPEEKQHQKIASYAENILELFHSESSMKQLSIGAFLKLLLIECNNICSLNPVDTDKDSAVNNVLRDFKKIVNSDYRREHSTTYYANRLHISPDHLNRTIKSKIGKTAKEYIQARIITEAKRLLYFTDVTTKEIAYEFGFNEPANFSAFFKNCTQMSPTTFKKREVNI